MTISVHDRLAIGYYYENTKAGTVVKNRIAATDQFNRDRFVDGIVEAWAVQDGRYLSLTCWDINQNNNLVGEIEIPMKTGLVDGATKSHPVARAAIKVLNVLNATEFGQVIAAAGLAENMFALRALVSEGTPRGSMALHTSLLQLQLMPAEQRLSM